MELLKIIQVVTFNDGEAWVLNRSPKMEYERHGDTIIGMDFPFFDCYYRENHIGRIRAFAGREFIIHLQNGEEIYCSGQWWSGVTDFARNLIGDEIGNVTAQGIERLRQCYVFTGYVGSRVEFLNFRAEYKGDVLPYWEYEKIVKRNL